MSQFHQKKVAMINDLSGYGRCSLTVAVPILSAMKVQCCPVPTSILSNHTGFPVYFFDDYTAKLIREKYLYSKPGEIIFNLPDKANKVPDLNVTQ